MDCRDASLRFDMYEACSMCSRLLSLEYRAVGGYPDRGGAIRRTQRARDLSPRAPGAALQELGHGEGRVETQLCSHHLQQWFEQRDGERAPLDDELRSHRVLHRGIDRCARANDAEVDEEPPVAIFGERGEFVEPSNGDPRRFERL